ncbi:MAG: hypothetical protein HQL44_13640 [Alphaproteobacteria bacterium]|nr:hypothetical protein [Alphaproteobacteria bacterium]
MTKAESELSDVEQLILNAARSGEFLRFPLDDKPKLEAAFLARLIGGAYGALHPRGIHVEGIELDGALDLENRDVAIWLYFVNCDFPKGLLLRDAKLAGLFMPGCKVEKGIRADRMKVSGAVLLTAGFSCRGGLILPAAEIGGVLSCIGGQFESEKGPAIDGSGLKVRDSLYLRANFKAKGEVRLLDAEIGGILSCIGGHFLNATGRAIYADGVKVAGGVFFKDGFQAEGDISLASADLGKIFSMRDGGFSGKLDLRDSQVKVFDDSENSWPAPGKLLIDGFRYERFSASAPLGFASRKRWLERQDTDIFTPQPYEQLARVLKSSGQRRDSRLTLMEKEREFRRKGKLRTFRWLWNHVLEATIGFGYTPWRAAIWLACFWLLGSVMFGWAQGVGAVADSGLALTGAQPFVPAIYSLDALLPLVDLKQEIYWLPQPNAPMGWLFLAYLWLHILAGWFLLSIGLFALSGVVKRDY